MGEAKQRREAGLTGLRWRSVRADPPPRDADRLVVQVRITCPCARGGVLALPAARLGGEWIVGAFDHAFEIDYWLQLPRYAPPPALH